MVMRIIRHAVTALAMLLAPPAWAEGFLGAYEDLPLAPGLTEVPGSGVVFDSPSGRIVEAHASGAVKSADILRFYAATLPQLGWTRESDTLYRREAEVLRLDPVAHGRTLAVRFAITPE
jgi:hypothetical protein